MRKRGVWSVAKASRRPTTTHRRRSTDAEPPQSLRPVIWVAAGVAGLDWATKAAVAGSVPLGRITEVVPGRVAFWHVRNDAMILGLFGDLPLAWRQGIAVLLAVVGLTLLREVLTRAHRLLPRRRPWAWIFVGLVLGGMIGNLGERVLHWWVTDFLSFRWGSIWLPPGNIADLAIMLSIPISGFVIAFEIEARAMRRPRHAVDEADRAEEGPPAS